jgi:valyl-tRNA synthetase
VVREDSPRGAAARQTLGVCLDALLRMLHPVMPFLTEALWSHLNAICPQRSISGVELDPSELCIKAPWPKIAPALIDDGMEQQFALMQQVVSAIREVRTTYKVPPRQKVALSAKAPAHVAEQLLAQQHLIETLANIEPHEVGPQAEKPADAAAAVVGEIELYLHGLIDADAERQRLAKRLEEIDASIRTLAGRLGSASYVDRAPAHLVQQTRDQLAAAQREKQAIEQQLAAVG